jgi:hypothetical protein
MGDLVANSALTMVLGTSLALVAMAIVASWFAGWYGERVRRAAVAARRGAAMRKGPSLVHGKARAIDGRPGGMLLTSTRTQVRARDRWHDVARVVSGSPFAVVLDNGEEVGIDPAHVVLSGFRETAGSPYLPQSTPLQVRREVVAHVSAGDAIWATGILSAKEAQGSGAYRSAVARRTLTAPKRGSVEVMRVSPVPRWAALATAHRVAALAAAAGLVAAHVIAFVRVDRALINEYHAPPLPLREAALAPLVDAGRLDARVAMGFVFVLMAGSVWVRLVTRARRSSERS